MAQANVVKLDGFNETLKWTFGLINHQGKYLTAEKFQCRISCGATSLRLKQVWTLEPRENGKVVFKSYLNKYIGADKNGKVFGDTDFDDLTPDNEFEI
ncbi:hypothetical protein, partial [Salmonella sp. s54836]|uniref:hypothetical protein n=1 Tax=Salmonella sp. s54836 TaxID=3159673 RepID=UPI0039815755